MLDIHALLPVTVLVSCLLGLLLAVLWLQDRRLPALLWWSATYFCAAAAIALSADTDAHGVAAGAFAMLACGLTWTGVRVHRKQPPQPFQLLVGVTLWLALTADAGALLLDPPALVGIGAAIALAYAIASANDLCRDRRSDRTHGFHMVVRLIQSAGLIVPPLTLLLAGEPPLADQRPTLLLATLLYLVAAALAVIWFAKDQIVGTWRQAALSDPLTGLNNRRAFDAAAAELMARRARRKLPVSVLAFDLDHFKSVNDRFGHPVGDEALRTFAATATATLRATDVLGRFGGEEFVALLPGTAEEAAVAAERVRAAFEQAGQEIAGRVMNATVSIGVAAAVPPVSLADLFKQADVALYRAKAGGRNRVELADAAVVPIRDTAAVPGAAPAPELVLGVAA